MNVYFAMVNENPRATYNQYKIRKDTITVRGYQYCLTVPREIQDKFKDVKFTVSISNNQIIFTSGQDLVQLRKDIGSVQLKDL